MHGVDIALAHEDRVVGADQHSAERVVAVRDRVAGDGIRGAEVGDHLVARHRAQPKAREASWEGGHKSGYEREPPPSRIALQGSPDRRGVGAAGAPPSGNPTRSLTGPRM